MEMNSSLLRPPLRQIFIRGELNSLFLVKFSISLHSLYTNHGSEATDEQSYEELERIKNLQRASNGKTHVGESPGSAISCKMRK